MSVCSKNILENKQSLPQDKSGGKADCLQEAGHCPGQLGRGELQVVMRVIGGVANRLWTLVIGDLVSFPKEYTLSWKTSEGFQANKGCNQVHKLEMYSLKYLPILTIIFLFFTLCVLNGEVILFACFSF